MPARRSLQPQPPLAVPPRAVRPRDPSGAVVSGLVLGFALALAGVSAGPAQAGDNPPRAIAQPKAVIELFTSQGCSSCPPADKLLAEIAERPDVMALTLAVDYWDYLGWKDTLAKHGHTARQKAYAKMRGDSKMFTPQAVVNGTAMAVGNDRTAVESAVATARPPEVPVTLAVRDGRLQVSIGAGAGAGEVWLCPVASRAKVDIGRGENEGTEITYHNVVRSWIKLGDWTGEPVHFEAPLRRPGEPESDAVAVMVQSGTAGEPGRILGAALVPTP